MVCPPLSEGSISEFKRRCAEYGYSPSQILPHDSYPLFGSPDAEGLKSRGSFEELHRCEQLGLDRLNFHRAAIWGKFPKAIA